MGFVGAGSTVGSPGGFLQGLVEVAPGTNYGTHAIGVNGLSRFRAVFYRNTQPTANLVVTVQHRVPQRSDATWQPLDVPVSVPATIGLPVVVEGVVGTNSVRVLIENRTLGVTPEVHYEVMVTPF